MGRFRVLELTDLAREFIRQNDLLKKLGNPEIFLDENSVWIKWRGGRDCCVISKNPDKDVKCSVTREVGRRGEYRIEEWRYVIIGCIGRKRPDISVDIYSTQYQPRDSDKYEKVNFKIIREGRSNLWFVVPPRRKSLCRG